MLTYGEQVPAVPRNENVHLRLSSTSKDQVIGRIACHRLRWIFGHRNQFSRKVYEKLLNSSPALRLESHPLRFLTVH
jgi:hypothetical protein